MTKKIIKRIALRILNTEKNKILLRKFKRSGVWSIPQDMVTQNSNEYEKLFFLINSLSLSNDFYIKKFSPLSIYTTKSNVWNSSIGEYVNNITITTVYNVDYGGLIKDVIIGNIFSDIKWFDIVDTNKLISKDDVTKATIVVMEKGI